VKEKRNLPAGLNDLCRKLKLQLDELKLEMEAEPDPLEQEEKRRRALLMEQLKRQLSDLSL
jgi:hypothetical protein